MPSSVNQVNTYFFTSGHLQTWMGYFFQLYVDNMKKLRNKWRVKCKELNLCSFKIL